MTELLQSLFKSGNIVDLILALMAIEAAGLMLWHFMTGSGVGPRALLPFLIAGVCLMVALKFALTGQDWTLVATALGGAFVFHLLDIVLRWQSGSPREPQKK